MKSYSTWQLQEINKIYYHPCVQKIAETVFNNHPDIIHITNECIFWNDGKSSVIKYCDLGYKNLQTLEGDFKKIHRIGTFFGTKTVYTSCVNQVLVFAVALSETKQANNMYIPIYETESNEFEFNNNDYGIYSVWGCKLVKKAPLLKEW